MYEVSVTLAYITLNPKFPYIVPTCRQYFVNHQGSPKGTLEMTGCDLWLSVSCSNYQRRMPHQSTNVYKLHSPEISLIKNVIAQNLSYKGKQDTPLSIPFRWRLLVTDGVIVDQVKVFGSDGGAEGLEVQHTTR